MIPREQLARQVKDALANLYDPIHLQTHPLADELLPDSQHEMRGQGLRQLLREAMESLRPDPGVALGRPEWLAHRVLWLRYVECLEQGEICRELGISRAYYFQQRKAALEAVVSLLWHRYREQAVLPREESEPPEETPGDLAREQAARLVQASPPQPVDLAALLEGIRQIMLPLAEQQGLAVTIEALPALAVTHGDPILWRQIALTVLAEAIHLGSGPLRLAVGIAGDEIVWRLRGLPPDVRAEQGGAFAIARGLLDGCGGRLWATSEADADPELCFAAPISRPRTILAIDDDPDAIALYRRYLQVGGYAIEAAPQAAEVRSLLARMTPDLILLDVLMPQEDGWDILRQLRAAPATAQVPILVCSVLGQPELALALGATGVLPKPVAREALLQAIETHLTRPKSPLARLPGERQGSGPPGQG